MINILIRQSHNVTDAVTCFTLCLPTRGHAAEVQHSFTCVILLPLMLNFLYMSLRWSYVYRHQSTINSIVGGSNVEEIPPLKTDSSPNTLHSLSFHTIHHIFQREVKEQQFASTTEDTTLSNLQGRTRVGLLVTKRQNSKSGKETKSCNTIINVRVTVHIQHPNESCSGTPHLCLAECSRIRGDNCRSYPLFSLHEQLSINTEWTFNTRLTL